MPPLVLAASVRGPSHERAGRRCEDAVAWARLGPRGVVLALADGAGSARHPRAGARAAADAGMRAVVALWRADPRRPSQGRLGLLARAGVCAGRAAVAGAAGGRGVAAADLACTLLVVLWWDGAAAVGHVGDGAAVGAGAGGWRMLSAPAETEYVNETRLLTDADWPAGLRLSPAEGGLDGLVAFTDGCQRAALCRGCRGPAPFPGFLDPVGRFAGRDPHPADGRGQLIRLLDSAKLRAASDDDKTLALIWRRERRA